MPTLLLVNTGWFKLVGTISDDINLEIVRRTKRVSDMSAIKQKSTHLEQKSSDMNK